MVYGLENAGDAARFLVEVVGPYVALKAADKVIGEEVGTAWKAVKERAREAWGTLRERLTGQPRLLGAFEEYEAKLGTAEAGREKPAAVAELEDEVRQGLERRFAHHPEDLEALLPMLKELAAAMPKGGTRVYGAQSATNVRNSTVIQSQGDGNQYHVGGGG